MFHLLQKLEFSARNDGAFHLTQKLEFGMRHRIWVYNVPFVSWKSKIDASGVVGAAMLDCKLKVVQVPPAFRHEKSVLQLCQYDFLIT